jgi:TP901 family phage tail tape measure protein
MGNFFFWIGLKGQQFVAGMNQIRQQLGLTRAALTRANNQMANSMRQWAGRAYWAIGRVVVAHRGMVPRMVRGNLAIEASFVAMGVSLRILAATAGRSFRLIGWGLARLRAGARGAAAAFRHLRTNFLAFTMVAAALAAPLALLERFNRAMARGTASMGFIDPEIRKKMREQAINVASQTTYSPSDVAEGYLSLGRAGLGPQESMGAIPTVAKFAQAGMMDMAEASEMLMHAQNAMGLRTQDATQNLMQMTRVANVLAKADINSVASVQQLGTALTNDLAGALRIVNKDLEEGVAMLAIFAQRGVVGAKAGTYASIALRDLQTRAIKNKQAFKDLGIEVFSGGKMNSTWKILGQLESALAGMSDEQRKMTLGKDKLGFQEKSIKALLTLLGSSGEMESMYASLKTPGDSVTQLSDAMMTPFQKSMAKLMASLQRIVEGLQPTLDVFTKLVENAAAYLDSLGGTKLNDLYLGVIKNIGNGFQLVIQGFLNLIFEVQNLLHRFRMGPMAERLGVGFDGEEDRLASARGSRMAQERAVKFSNMPWFSEIVDQWVKDAENKRNAAAPPPHVGVPESADMFGVRQNERFNDLVGTGMYELGRLLGSAQGGEHRDTLDRWGRTAMNLGPMPGLMRAWRDPLSGMNKEKVPNTVGLAETGTVEGYKQRVAALGGKSPKLDRIAQLVEMIQVNTATLKEKRELEQLSVGDF